jgi:hypothetical protein
MDPVRSGVNLVDREQTLVKLGTQTDMTHVSWTTWVQGKNEKENIENSIDTVEIIVLK